MKGKPNRARITVALIEEESLVRSLMADFIEQRGSYRVVLQADHGAALVAAARACRAPVLAVVALCRVERLQREGHDTITWIKEHWPGTHILAITCERDGGTVLRVAQAGACGVICRATDLIADLADALRQILANGHYEPPYLMRLLGEAAKQREEDEAHINSIKPAERRVLEAVCAAPHLTWPLVAKRLHLSLATVETHCAALFRKLRVQNRSELILEGQRLGFGQGKW